MKNLFRALSLILAVTMIALFAVSCGGAKTVETYLATEEGQAEIEKVQDTFKNTLDVKVYAEDNDLFYDYKYLTQYEGATVDTLKESLTKSFDTQASTFESVITQMEEVVDGEVTLTVIYRNADDSVLAEKTFN